MSVLTELQKKLADAGLGTYDVDIRRGRMPATPDVMCVVQAYPGFAPEKRFGVTGIYIETPAVQVVFRGAPDDMDGPMARAQTAYQELAKVEATSLTGGGTTAFYHEITPRQPPNELKRDFDGRVYIAFNVLAEKELSA